MPLDRRGLRGEPGRIGIWARIGRRARQAVGGAITDPAFPYASWPGPGGKFPGPSFGRMMRACREAAPGARPMPGVAGHWPGKLAR